MEVAGSRSWRCVFDVPDAAHVGLFVRDALRLDLGDGAPPRLGGAIPDRSLLIGDRVLAGSLWCSWWRSGSPLELVVADLIAVESAGLGGAAEQLRQDARAWLAANQSSQLPPERDAMRDWEVTRDAVESAARELGVEPGDLRADTALLIVRDVWCAHPRPGQLVYSPGLRDDPGRFGDELRRAFRSSLTGA